MKVNDIDMDAVILGNGEYPTHSMPETMLIMAPYVVCCDGSADEHIRRGFTPDAIIGDGDSLTGEQGTVQDHLPPDRRPGDERSDQSGTLPARPRQKTIILVGATGKREDHTLGNISLLIDYMKAGAQVTMLTDHGMFIPASGRNCFKSYPGQQISIFNFNATGLRADGLVYPLSDFSNWWQGTLNEATGTEFTIHAEGDYLVYLNY